jgi:glycosyltransferase involved in cell wall biosynthesis
MDSSTRNTILINNAFLNSPNHTSGGDVRFVDIILNSSLSKNKITIYCSGAFRTFIEEYLMEKYILKTQIEFTLSPKWFDNFPTIICYILRCTWLTFKLLRVQKTFILCASDQFPDLIPVIINKLRPNFNTVGFCTYHLLPTANKRHGYYIINRASSFFQNIVFRLSNFIDFSVYPTKLYSDQVKSMFGIKHRQITIPMQLVLNANTAPSARILPNYDLIYLGRISKNKGVFYLPEIVANLDSKGSLRIGIVGSGKKNVVFKLKQMINKLGIEVDFLGYLSEYEKVKLLENSACLMLPSEEEGFSLTILEALSFSMEVVAWDLIELKSIYGDQIRYARQNNVQDFAERIEEAIENSRSQKRRIQMKDLTSKNNTSRFEEFNKLLKELNEF